MHPALRTAAALLAGGWLLAQTPTRSDATAWSDAETCAYSGLLRLRSALRRGDAPSSLPRAAVEPAGYDLRVAAEVGRDVVFSPRETADKRFFVLAWPKDGQRPPRRAMLLYDDGTALVADIAQVDGTSPVQHLFAAGGSGRFADVLRQPGKSVHGDLWLLLDQVSTSADVDVVDAHGAPLAGAFVTTGPEDPQDRSGDVALSAPMPVACAATDAAGRALLRGPRGTASCLRLDFGSGAPVLASELRLEHRDGALRLAVDTDAIRARREQGARAVLAAVAAAQEHCRALCAIDANHDHDGEYGFLGELSGVDDLPMQRTVVGPDVMKPPLLGDAFRDLRRGRVAIGGYLFQVWLPDKRGRGIAEEPSGTRQRLRVDPRRARELWCAYAWPAESALGGRVLFVNQTGDLFASDNDDRRYAGHERAPAAEAAFVLDGSGALDTKPANEGRGRDGWPWHVLR